MRLGQGEAPWLPGKDDHRIHDRGAAPLPRGHRRFHRADELRGARVQAHQLHRRTGRARRRARFGACDQRAGRDAEEARRHLQRNFHQHQRIRRPPRRHGLGGNGRAVPHSAGISSAASTCWCSIRSTAPATSTSTSRSAASSRVLRAPQAARERPTRRATSCSRAPSRCAPAMRSTARRPCWC